MSAGGHPFPAAVVGPSRIVERDRLARELERAVTGLVGHGVRPGDRVVLVCPNTYEFVLLHLTLDRLGAVTVNLPAAMRGEVSEVAGLVDARLVVLQDPVDRDRYGELPSAVVVEGEAAMEQLLGAAPGPAAARPDRAAPGSAGGADAPAWLAFTSGSTGAPRGALHTRASLAASTRRMGDRYRLGPDDAILVAAPVGHGIGFTYGVRLACDRGARLVLLPRWDPELALRLVERERCTFAAIPTPFLADLVELGAGSRGWLRHLLVGGAPVPPDQVERADELFGDGVTSGYYGASECGAALTSPPGTPGDERRASDGLPMEGIEIRLQDDRGAAVADGEEGELTVRGEQVAEGYWGDADREAQFLADGWFATRDLARRRESGYVKVTGRIKSMIIRGGVNVAPQGVEQAVLRHPQVGRVAVVGVPDRRLGEVVGAAVTASGEPLTREELRAWLADAGVARSKWPDVVQVVEDLPRSPTGKVDLARVRELLARLASSPAGKGSG